AACSQGPALRVPRSPDSANLPAWEQLSPGRKTLGFGGGGERVWGALVVAAKLSTCLPTGTKKAPDPHQGLGTALAREAEPGDPARWRLLVADLSLKPKV